ncbi:MAG TPA: fused MFS/spermidine synthase [Alphaproteobacteria bacterium]|nr:fused MFS/spermidine synthase [Micavibrio sp.]HQX26569.1 fused MFS/spermidine synthase [Alphaproteobacteria bacterium]
MDSLKRTLLLFAVIIIEGYVVLATELLAIRETIAYVGSGTDTVSIIIAAVLMPLAFGYYKGGLFKPFYWRGKLIGIREKLILNIMISMAILILGLSYICMNVFFYTLLGMGLNHRLFLTAIYAAVFLVTPVYLLGQTIPLISNYFSKEKLSRITGRMLFFSTMGSFMGAVFSTLVLMSTVGVHNTVSFNIILLAVLVILLSKKKLSERVVYAFGMAVVGIILNSGYVMAAFHVVDNNKYNMVMVFPDPSENGDIHMSLNHMGSSMYNPETGSKHMYIEFVEQQTIEPILETIETHDILVIGAGAFTFGLQDTKNNYDFVDIDGSLKDIAEQQVLKQKLTENKKFIPMEARAYLMSTQKKYDVIFLDAYLGGITLPEHLVTANFYRQVKDHLKDHGIVAMNFIASPSFTTPFSRNLDNTVRRVFPHISRHVIMENYNLWKDKPEDNQNIIYMYKRHTDESTKEIYTDNKNRIFYDKPQKY